MVRSKASLKKKKSFEGAAECRRDTIKRLLGWQPSPKLNLKSKGKIPAGIYMASRLYISITKL